MRLAENDGDSSQDGCAFHVTDLTSLFAEFKANGLQKELSDFTVEEHGGKFYVVLRNVGGVMAVYRIRNEGILKGLKRWPEEIE